MAERRFQTDASARAVSLSSSIKKAFARLPGPVRSLFRGPIIPPLRGYLRYSGGPGRRAIWRLASHLWWLERPVTARTRWGARLRVDAQDIVGRYIYWFGEWEPNLTRWLQRSLKPGDGFVDVGAYVGYFSILASQLVKDGPVVAVEALPDTHACLLDNMARNGTKNVRAVNVAAWDSKGELEFFASGKNLTGTATLYRDWAERWQLSRQFRVPALPLSSILTEEEAARARVIKIDVEGAELHVLRGLVALLPGCRRDLELVVEVAPRILEDDGDSWQEMADLLATHGYEPRLLPNDYSASAYLSPRFDGPLPSAEIPRSAEQFDVVFTHA